MYVHQQDWASATRVAEQNDPANVPDVLVAQAKVCLERQEFTKAEALYVRAKKPELAVKAYKDASRWNDATRIAKEFLPHKVQELMAEHNAFLRGDAAGGRGANGGAGDDGGHLLQRGGTGGGQGGGAGGGYNPAAFFTLPHPCGQQSFRSPKLFRALPFTLLY